MRSVFRKMNLNDRGAPEVRSVCRKVTVNDSGSTGGATCYLFRVLPRAERFCDGAIGKFFEEGHMIKCLKVLEGRIRNRF